MEIIFDKYSYKDIISNLSIKINNNMVVGIYGDRVYKVIDKLSKKDKIANRRIKLNEHARQISYSLINSSNVSFKYKSVNKELEYYCKKNKKQKKNIEDVLNNYINILGLSRDIIYRKIYSLSTSEKYKVFILLNTLFNKHVYIFVNAYRYLDTNNIKKLNRLMSVMRENDKVVIIYDDDINNIFLHTDKTLLIDNDQTVLRDTFQMFTNEEVLKKYKNVPDLSLISFLARKKNIKISYHKDVRDIIKDIYKHV